jgi:ATP-binding cassette subfamily F protein 3
MLQVSGLTKAYGARSLFEDVTFTIGKGEVVGLVGRNGSGKSTLFKVILGIEQSDRGEISCPKGYKIGYLDQHIKFTKPTVIEECATALPEEYFYEFYRCEKILFGLGFTEADMERAPTEFSGGYQLRINLAKCLVQEPDLLLLDEPTNYLDIVSLRWMRQFLNTLRGEAIIITHDRDFMDSVVSHTMGLNRKRLRKTEGDTEKYYEQLALEDEIYEKTRANQEKKLVSMQRFVDRFKAKASKATQAQSVAKKIAKMSVLTQLDEEQMMGFRFHYKEIAAKRIAQIENLSFGFGEDLLFEGLNFEVKSDDRIAVVGKNGRGKTTLLNLIAGQLKPLEGAINIHPGAKIGYYQQTNRKELGPENTVVQEIESANGMLDQTAVRSICGAMMFSGGDAEKKIKVLSGGEQGRVLLGKVLANANNFLLLDEPTNHLDMESIGVMTEEIDQFPGAVVFVTHDEQMLHRLATKLIVFRNGDAEVFDGTYPEFLEKWGWDEEDKPKKKKKSPEQEARILSEEEEKAKKRDEKKREKDRLDTEAKIMELETKLTELNHQLSTTKVGADPGAPIYKEIAALQKEIEALYSKI